MSENIILNEKNIIELLPNYGLKDISFGMFRKDIRKIMIEKLGENDFFLRSAETDCYLKSSLQFTYEEDDTLTHIEVSAPPPTYVTLLGINTWELSRDELSNTLCKYDSIESQILSTLGLHFFSNKYIALWGCDKDYDHIGGYKVAKWGSIAIGDKRYRDRLITLSQTLTKTVNLE